MARSGIFILLLLLAGCNNPCQQLCVRMAAYAEECGFTVSDAELDACLTQEADIADAEERKVCADYGNAETIRQRLSCDDLAEYWGGTAIDTP